MLGLNGYKGSVCNDEKLCRAQWWRLHNRVAVLHATALTVRLKTVKMVSFMLRICNHNKNNTRVSDDSVTSSIIYSLPLRLLHVLKKHC